MKRRGALKTMTVVAGTSVLLPSFSACRSSGYEPAFFSKQDFTLVEAVSETILPRTPDAPGATDCRVANFVDTYINDCYSIDDQERIIAGLEVLKVSCEEKYKKQFEELSIESMEEFLIGVDREATAQSSPHYFSKLKSTIVFAYFTSKEGVEAALDYIPIPGKYVGDYPMSQDQKTWAL